MNPTQSQRPDTAQHTPTPESPWYVGDPIRSTDTVGICVRHFDGEEIEETIAEVLPSTDGNATRDKQAAFIVRAVNSHAELVRLLQLVADSDALGLPKDPVSNLPLRRAIRAALASAQS
jgi:hypothetical protein